MILRIVILILFFTNSSYCTAVRIKDIVSVEGIRDNILVGYGLVVGLNGTGNNLKNSNFTQSRLIEFLQGLGVNSKGANLKTKNVAAVVVTAKLPPFARQGSRIDIKVSTLGDAKSLQDGTLLATTLLGADGQVYAVAQGQVFLGSFKGQDANGNQINKSASTNAIITNGGIIEKEVNFDLAQMDTINLALHNPDLTTSLTIADTINIAMGETIAHATDPGTVKLYLTAQHQQEVVRFLSKIEKLYIEPDSNARIVIDEVSGTIVMGKNVRINPIAIRQGNLNVIIEEQKDALVPEFNDPEINALTDENDDLIKKEKGEQMIVMPSGVSIGELVDGLNSLGVSPNDLINILQTIKAAGALQAEIILK